MGKEGAEAILDWTRRTGNNNGAIGFQIMTVYIIDYFKDKFTQAGNTRQMFYESQLENYKKDPAFIY